VDAECKIPSAFRQQERITVKISIRDLATETFVPMLQSLSNYLDKAAQHATAKKLNPAVLINARLAPDMYTLAQQVLLACDHAKNTTARLIALEAPRMEDSEQTLDDLKARITRTIHYVQGIQATAFEGAEDREIKIDLPGNNGAFVMNGLQFLRDWALPHFYFHVVTAYDILRHNGVDLGKRDYMSHVARYIRPS
jgi:uncharacterized protein